MLAQYLRRRVSVITVDGRYLVGVLHAADQLLNLVLTSCVERVFDKTVESDPTQESHGSNKNKKDGSSDGKGANEMQESSLGVMMIRGCDVVCVVAIDTMEEAKISSKAWRGLNLPAAARVPRAAVGSGSE